MVLHYFHDLLLEKAIFIASPPVITLWAGLTHGRVDSTIGLAMPARIIEAVTWALRSTGWHVP